MRSVVTEIRGNHAVVLNEDGTFTRVDNHHYKIGMEVRINKKQLTAQHFKRLAALAASFSLVFIISLSAFSYFSPTAYVSIDINPSLELTLNRYERVIRVKTFDPVSEKLAPSVRMRGMKIDQAVQNLVDQLVGKNIILKDQDSQFVIAVASKNKEYAEQLSTRLQNSTAELAGKKGLDITLHNFTTPLEYVQIAEHYQTTAGKMYLVENLKTPNEETNLFDAKFWVQQSIQEIMQEMHSRQANVFNDHSENEQEFLPNLDKRQKEDGLDHSPASDLIPTDRIPQDDIGQPR